MRLETEIGRVVWHDLLTSDVARARRFYAELLGWEYRIEHAADFVWKPGEAQYPLIIGGGAAHGGFVDSGDEFRSHWVAYVMVEDVDAATEKAKRLGAKIQREPFDAPGVGRNAMIRDPQGATICLHVATHDFPAPTGTFLRDELLTGDVEQAGEFYRTLFGWPASQADGGRVTQHATFQRAGQHEVIGARRRPIESAKPAAWIPYLATDDVEATTRKAAALGASLRMEKTDVPGSDRCAVLEDPTGAPFGLQSRPEFPRS